jgi:hypothetical protein
MANGAAWDLWNANPTNHQFLIEHLNGGEADVEAFLAYIRSGQFSEAKKLANGELLSAIGGTTNTTQTEAILNSADIVRLMEHHIRYGGGFRVNIGKNKPVQITTIKKDKMDDYVADYAETYKITEKQIEKMKNLKPNKGMVFTAKDGTEYIAKASTNGESIAIYKVPSQKKLDIYLQKDGYFFVTNQAIDVLSLGAGVLIGSIDVGKFDLSLTGGIEGSQSVLRSDPENWLLTSPNLENNKVYNAGKAYAGAEVSYPLGKVIEIFVDACGAATFGQEFTPHYTANVGAGAKANLGGLYLGISLSKMFEPGNKPITVAGANIGYSSKWGNVDISGGFYLDPLNIDGKNPYYVGAKVTFDLDDVVGVFKRKR